ALADANEHGGAAEVLGDADDHLLDEHRLAHAGAAEQADLAALDVRRRQVDDLDARLQHLGLRLQLRELGGVPGDVPVLVGLELLALFEVEALADGVEDLALDAVADRDLDLGAGVGHLGAADQAVGRGHADGADLVVTQVLRDLHGEARGLLALPDLDVQRVEDLRNGIAREFDVDDRPDDPYDASHSISVSHRYSFPAAERALAPPSISLISCVIAACRAAFALRRRVLINSSALSVAAFMARRLAASSLAAASINAA